ncbi:hypothetical protein ACHAQH_001992 [Verticillium albo-atrum]
MDNFNNCTVEDGALVTMRRGFQVSKAKHNGISFVNVIAGSEQAPKKTSESQLRRGTELTNLSQPLERRFRFVNKHQEPRAPRVIPRPKGAPQVLHTEKAEKHKPLKAKSNVPRAVSGHVGPVYLYNTTSSSSEDAESLNKALDEFKQSYQSAPYLSMTSWRAEVWATHNYSVPMSVSKQKLLHVYMRFIPFKMYPLESILSHNPTRSPKFFERLQVTPNSLVSVTVAGSLVEAVLTGQRCSDAMLEQESYACGVVNGELQKSTKLRGQKAHGIMECICSMAVGSAHLGRHDHWHMHMKGLKQIIEMIGGIDKSWAYVMNKVRRANVKAAAALATSPYLEYERVYGNISDSLPRTTRARLSNAVKSILSLCNVQQVIIESFASLVLFTHAVSVALAAKKRTILYDPEAFIEEWLWVEYQFIRFPGVLRDETTPIPSIELDLNLGERRYKEPFVRGTRYCAPGKLLPTHADNIIEPAVRLAGLLYVDALVPDEPRTLNGYAVLLGLLTTAIENILARLAARGRQCGDGEVFDDGLPSMAAMRPILIWVGLTGFMVAWAGDGERFWGLGRYDRTMYRECLVQIIGSTPESVDMLLEEDLALCRLLDAKNLVLKDIATRTVLKGILMEHSDGEEFKC